MGSMLLANIFNPKNRTHWFWGIAFLALFIEMCFHALLPISISNDSYGYISLSRNIFSPNVAFERSVGYSLFLAFMGINLFDSLIPAILAQAAMAVAIPLIVFKCLERFGLGYAVLGAGIACLYFYNFVVSGSILTEPFYVFAIALYSYSLICYFRELTTRNLLWVIAACWLIALIRLSGSQYFLSLLVGIGFYVLIQFIKRNHIHAKQGMKQLGIALAVYFAISIPYSLITNRTSSVVWPHFVFNWVYKDSSAGPIYLGIIKPENGPATQKLFKEIERIVTEYPVAFDTLKAGGSDKVKALKPTTADKKYSPEAVKLLMDDLINNNKHDLRSWWIEGTLSNYGNGIRGTSKLLADAIFEGFRKHPETIVQRMIIVLRDRVWLALEKGIEVNIVTFPTAYHHQVPKVINDEPALSLKPGIYKQWTYDMYQHTGTAAVDRDVFYANRYPSTLEGAKENIKTDNLIGFAHYVGVLGMQVLRLCWVFIGIGIFIFPFTKNGPLLASLLCASLVPPIISVFLSETDGRHLLMCSPIHFVTAVVVMYTIAGWFRKDGHAK